MPLLLASNEIEKYRVSFKSFNILFVKYGATSKNEKSYLSIKTAQDFTKYIDRDFSRFGFSARHMFYNREKQVLLPLLLFAEDQKTEADILVFHDLQQETNC